MVAIAVDAVALAVAIIMKTATNEIKKLKVKSKR